MTVAPAYFGPQCPRCGAALSEESIHSGVIICPHCNHRFEGTVFHPPERNEIVTTEVVTVGPEGANACANHARNAATASCQRCGLFICALCDMNVGTGSYCPACFDRMRAEGSVQTVARRYRDDATIARTAAIAGLFLSMMFLGLPAGILAIVFAIKARRQRRAEGRSVVGVTFTMIVGLLEILGGLVWVGFLIWAIGKAATTR
jgi:hypothetical protein